MTNPIVSAPSVEASDALFALYKSEFGATKTREDFYNFLATPSAERNVFFDAYANHTIDELGNVIILNVKKQ